MDENFDKSLDFVFEHEGGLVNDSADPGGITNLGISFRFLKGLSSKYGDINDDGNVDAEDIRDMTVEDAARIYKKSFWYACRCDELPWPLDAILFDTGINMGTGTAVKLLQRVLKLKDDGSFGPITKAAVDGIPDTNYIAEEYLDRRREYYRSLAGGKPRFKKFLKGWLSRVDDLEGFIKET